MTGHDINLVEALMAGKIAKTLADRLPRTLEQEKNLMQTGAALARMMSWNNVIKTYGSC